MAELQQMLRTKEAAKILSVHSNTLRRWCDAGLIRFYRIGKRRDRRFALEDINAALKEQTSFSSR